MSSRNLVAENTPRKGYLTLIDYESSSTGLHASSITVKSDSKPVTATVLREVKPMELMRKDMIDHPNGRMQVATALCLIRDDFDFPEEIDPVSVRLQAVRRIYEHAVANGKPPAQAVAEAMNASIATAGRWIRRSKDRFNWG